MREEIMRKSRKICAFLLSLVIMIMAVPVSVFADSSGNSYTPPDDFKVTLTLQSEEDHISRDYQLPLSDCNDEYVADPASLTYGYTISTRALSDCMAQFRQDTGVTYYCTDMPDNCMFFVKYDPASSTWVQDKSGNYENSAEMKVTRAIDGIPAPKQPAASDLPGLTENCVCISYSGSEESGDMEKYYPLDASDYSITDVSIDEDSQRYVVYVAISHDVIDKCVKRFTADTGMYVDQTYWNSYPLAWNPTSNQWENSQDLPSVVQLWCFEAWENPFSDVHSGDYYYKAARWAASLGIATGTSSAVFDPNVICTRAQIVTFLWREIGSPEPKSVTSSFKDVPENAYYWKAVQWAVENGITTGTSSTSFNPLGTCSRAEAITFLWRSRKIENCVLKFDTFSDVKSGAYYEEPVRWALLASVTKGVTESQFKPDDKCTRGQIITMMYRCHSYDQ